MYIGNTGGLLKDRITSNKSDINKNKKGCTLVNSPSTWITQSHMTESYIVILEHSNIFQQFISMNSRSGIEGTNILALLGLKQ